MVKRGVKSKGRVKKAVKKTAKKAVKKVAKKQHKPKVSKKIVKPVIAKPAPEPKPVVVEAPVEEKRILKKLPLARPKDAGRQAMRVFGHEISPGKIKAAAVEAYNKRSYTIDDIQVDQYIKENEWDNLMTKIGILDRVEEQLNLMYPHIDVVRKNKISIELYLSE